MPLDIHTAGRIGPATGLQGSRSASFSFSLEFPADYLDGKTFTSTLGSDTVAPVVNGDTMTVSFSETNTNRAKARWTLFETTGALDSQPVLTALFVFDDLGGSDPDLGPFDVTISGGLTVEVTVIGTSEAGAGTGITDGDKGDITVSGSGTVWEIDADVLAGFATATALADEEQAREDADALHAADTSTHGIADTSVLETQAGAQAKADAKVADAINNGTTTVAPSQNAVFDALAAQSTALGDHEADTTGIHGIPDTSLLETTAGAQAKADAKVTQNITNGTTTTAPSEDAVFDALALKAPLASPGLTGTPTAPTAAPGTNTTQLATTAFAQAAIAALIASAPGALDTLDELAAAMGDDANFATTITNALATKETPAGAQAKADAKVTQTITNAVTTTAPSEDAVFDALALKAPLASPTFTGTVALPADQALTGNPTAPNQGAGNSTQRIANTNFVTGSVATALATAIARANHTGTQDISTVTRSVNAQTGTSYTLVIGDAGDLVTMSNASAQTLTVPANSTVAFPVGTVIEVAQVGAAATSIAAAGGVTVSSPHGTLTIPRQYARAILTKIATDSWLLDFRGQAQVELGYVESTAQFSTTSTTAVDVTGMTLTVEVGNRPIMLEAWDQQTYNSIANKFCAFAIQEGATILSALYTTHAVANALVPWKMSRRLTPSVGSHTYKLTMLVQGAGGSTGFINQSSVDRTVLRVVEV